MAVKIVSPGEFDRHDNEVRFIASIDGQQASISITTSALFLIGEALGMPNTEPLIVFASSGNLLNQIVADVAKISGESQATYLVTHVDVLRTTGSEVGLPHVPKRWKAR